ncbi:MAG: M20/M25/M40 family metallo-hydrolase, partial [Clostridia bacterium]|nr:M20/M25/M40 family metallo-hydrolase [Clostridia bacterium]
DDRACAAAVITILKNIQKENLPFDVYAVFAAKEEVGGFGAMTATYSIMPDIAIAIDVCHGVTPDNSKDAYEIGDGCVIDVGPNIHPKISDRLIATAKEFDIKHQIEVEGGNTGTDAWVMQVVGEGIPTGLLSVPLKYMHTTVETISVSDVEAVANLLTFFLKNLNDEMEEWLCL